MNNKLLSQFEELQKLPKGILIERPDELIPTIYRLSRETRETTGVNGRCLVFSRLSLKHVTEKGEEGRRLLSILPVLLSRPIEIRTAKESNRFQVISSSKDYKDGRLHSIVIERMKNGYGMIVTIFQTDEGYLEHYELLWRTAGIV